MQIFTIVINTLHQCCFLEEKIYDKRIPPKQKGTSAAVPLMQSWRLLCLKNRQLQIYEDDSGNENTVK